MNCPKKKKTFIFNKVALYNEKSTALRIRGPWGLETGLADSANYQASDLTDENFIFFISSEVL